MPIEHALNQPLGTPTGRAAESVEHNLLVCFLFPSEWKFKLQTRIAQMANSRILFELPAFLGHRQTASRTNLSLQPALFIIANQIFSHQFFFVSFLLLLLLLTFSMAPHSNNSHTTPIPTHPLEYQQYVRNIYLTDFGTKSKSFHVKRRSVRPVHPTRKVKMN